MEYFSDGTNILPEELKKDAVGEKKSTMTAAEMSIFKAQITAYKMLARNKSLSKSLLNQVTDRRVDDPLPPPYESPVELQNGEMLPYDLMKVLTIHQQRATTRTTTLPTPPGIDPQVILKERESRIQNRLSPYLLLNP